MPETPRQERGPLTYLTLVCTQEELKGRPPPYPSPHLAQGATGQNDKDRSHCSGPKVGLWWWREGTVFRGK